MSSLRKLGFYRTTTGAVSNVLLNLVLIPRYSALGAADATDPPPAAQVILLQGTLALGAGGSG